MVGDVSVAAGRNKRTRREIIIAFANGDGSLGAPVLKRCITKYVPLLCTNNCPIYRGELIRTPITLIRRRPRH